MAQIAHTAGTTPAAPKLLDTIGQRCANIGESVSTLEILADRLCGSSPAQPGPRPVPAGAIAQIDDALDQLQGRLYALAERLSEIA